MTALDAKVRATGLIAQQAYVDHAIENGLQPAGSISTHDDGLRLYINGDSTKWVESIHVEQEYTKEAVSDDREMYHVIGLLPAKFFGVRVHLVFSRVATPAVLRAVTSA